MEDQPISPDRVGLSKYFLILVANFIPSIYNRRAKPLLRGRSRLGMESMSIYKPVNRVEGLKQTSQSYGHVYRSLVLSVKYFAKLDILFCIQVD
jgi:hypothetical protein